MKLTNLSLVPAGVVLGAFAFALVPGKAAGPLEHTPPAAQAWATDTASVLTALGTWVPGTLPPPDPRQRKPPCDPDMELEAQGFCWVGLLVKPPCPEGKAYEHRGACYGRSIRPERLPTTGEPKPTPLANPGSR